jgi:hypothetical protein
VLTMHWVKGMKQRSVNEQMGYRCLRNHGVVHWTECACPHVSVCTFPRGHPSPTVLTDPHLTSPLPYLCVCLCPQAELASLDLRASAALDLQQREAAIAAQQQAVAAAEAAVTRERNMLARERQQLQVGAGRQPEAMRTVTGPASDVQFADARRKSTRIHHVHVHACCAALLP